MSLVFARTRFGNCLLFTKSENQIKMKKFQEICYFFRERARQRAACAPPLVTKAEAMAPERQKFTN